MGPGLVMQRLVVKRGFCRLIFCALCFLVWVGPVAAVRLPRLEIETRTLANGLRVVLLQEHASPVVTLEVWYHVGSKDEKEGRRGFAHLFEHLMFSATRNLRRGRFASDIVRSGGISNAYTTEDATVLWETFPRHYLRRVLWLEADRMQNLEISAEDLRREIQVVKEERRFRFDNSPYGTVLESLYQHAFTVHPYRQMPIGSMQDLEQSRLDEVREFYRVHFTPNHAALILVGDFQAKQALGWINQYFAPIPRGPDAPRRPSRREPEQSAKRALRLRKNVALPAIVKGYHMPEDGSPDSYPLKLIARILAEGESSRLYRRLVVEKQSALDVQSVGNFTEHPNLFMIYALMHTGYAPADGEREIETELERLRSEPVSSEEITRARNQLFRDLALERRRSKSLADLLGYATVILNNPQAPNREISRFLAVAPDQIQRVARKIFRVENQTLLEIFPEEPAGKDE